MFVAFALSAVLAFNGPVAPTRVSRSVVSMSDAANTRRELVTRGVAALGGLVVAAESASAKAGEGPKFSVFGIGASPDRPVQSEPFEQMDTKISDPNKVPLVTGEKFSTLAKKVGEGEKRLGKDVLAYIKKESWALGRGQMRSMMYEMRAGMRQVNDGLSGPKKVDAKDAYEKFIADIEALDYQMELKDQKASLAAQAEAMDSLKAWKTLVGA